MKLSKFSSEDCTAVPNLGTWHYLLLPCTKFTNLAQGRGITLGRF